MAMPSPTTLIYYSSPGDHTPAGQYSSWLDGLPLEIEPLTHTVQSLLIHVLEAWRYGFDVPAERRREVEIGSCRGILSRALELDPRPLTEPRTPERRVVVTCHDLSVVLCSVLRHHGRPARPRAGFAAYLNRGMFVDHWLCEVWSSEQERWLRVDAQLDTTQCAGYAITFDPNDVPPASYVTGAEAWQLCRTGKLDPENLGFLRWRGWGYLRHVLLRDAFALTKREGVPWTSLGLPEQDEGSLGQKDYAALDDLASAAMADELGQVKLLCERTLSDGRPPDFLPWTLADVT